MAGVSSVGIGGGGSEGGLTGGVGAGASGNPAATGGNPGAYKKLLPNQQAAETDAIAGGHLIFPFEAELNKLSALEGKGQILDDERERLGSLKKGFSQFQTHDAIYRKAVRANDYVTAGHQAKITAKNMRGLAR